MKNLLMLFFSLLALVSCSTKENDEPQSRAVAPVENGSYFGSAEDADNGIEIVGGKTSKVFIK